MCLNAAAVLFSELLTSEVEILNLKFSSLHITLRNYYGMKVLNHIAAIIVYQMSFRTEYLFHY